MQVRGLEVVSGRDFACDGCGDCCTVFSKVDLHLTDVFRISAYLGIPPAEFFQRHCKVIEAGEGAIFLLDVEGGCPFRREGKCAIYPVRPDTCALYPFNVLCLSVSAALQRDMAGHPTCAAHRLPAGLIVVPDLERMIDSRILFTMKEAYLAAYGREFREAEARAFHERGLAQLRNERLRNVVGLQLLNEFQKAAPKGEQGGPLLSAGEIKQIYQYARGL